MSLNYILPNGVTIGFNSEAERDAYLNSAAGQGGQTQESALAANPGQTIQQIANDRGMAWNAPGAPGYLNAMAQGHNDPTSNQYAPQPFSQSALQQYGGGLLGGGSSSGGGGLLGGGGGSGGMGGGTGGPSMAPVSAAPIYQNVGNVAGAASQNPLSVSPTIPSFQQPPQSFADLLSEYGAFQAPLLNNGINWMTPSVTPGAINIMNANLSRRPL